jgi:hypothetical protein
MDRLFGIVAFVAFAAFLSVIVLRVPEPDLIVVFAIVLLMVAWDFWRSLRPRHGSDHRRRNGQERDSTRMP